MQTKPKQLILCDRLRATLNLRVVFVLGAIRPSIVKLSSAFNLTFSTLLQWREEKSRNATSSTTTITIMWPACQTSRSTTMKIESPRTSMKMAPLHHPTLTAPAKPQVPTSLCFPNRLLKLQDALNSTSHQAGEQSGISASLCLLRWSSSYSA